MVNARCYIDFLVYRQDLRRLDKNIIAAGAAGTVAARFELSDEWGGLAIVARFEHAGAVYDVPLDDGCAIIPREALQAHGFIVSLYGEDSSGNVLTSKELAQDVDMTIDVAGVEPIPSSPSLIQRFTDTVSAVAENTAAAQAAAQAAKDEVDRIIDAGIEPYTLKDYNVLNNKPSINGVELAGEKSLEDLGIHQGGGGTVDYNDLINKPQIEGVELAGNKLYSELNLLGLTNAEIEEMLT